MPQQDKALLMHRIDETLRTRMFANLLEEAESEIQDHLDEFEITHTGPGQIETDDLLQVYLDAKRVSGRSEKTLLRYRYLIERFMKAVGVKTRDVTTHHARAYLAAEKARGVSDHTLDGVRQVINAYFDWLEHEKLIPLNPIANIEPIKYQKKERLSLSAADIEILKRSCSNLRDNAIISFLLATGCRISEMVSLNRSDVDLEKGECIVLGKGNKERTVFLDDVAVLTLREYLASRSDSCPALFASRLDRRLTAHSVRFMMVTLSEKTGIKNVHPHRFRRTAVTRLLNRGMPIQEVAILVGHERLDTTMEYYAASKARIRNSYRMYSN